MAKRSRVLVVDDSPVSLTIFQEVLQDNFNLRFACNGEDALREVHRFKPEVILLDVQLPQMNGYEVCQHVRSAFTNDAVSVIMVSAHVTAEDREQGYLVGADDYITKPFSQEELLKKVSNVTRLRRVQDAPSLSTDRYQALPKGRDVPAHIYFTRDIQTEDREMHISVRLSHLLDGDE